MIHTHSLGRAARYYPEQTALVSERKRLTFREAHDRVENIAAALSRHGFQKGDRLAILLPNEPECFQRSNSLRAAPAKYSKGSCAIAFGPINNGP